MAKSQKELETQIENQKNQLSRYETRLKGKQYLSITHSQMCISKW